MADDDGDADDDDEEEEDDVVDVEKQQLVDLVFHLFECCLHRLLCWDRSPPR